MALSDYAALLCWAGAALLVYAGAAVASRRGWVSTDHRPLAAVMLLNGLLVQRATAPKLRGSRGPQAAGAEAAAGNTPRGGAYSGLRVIAFCLVVLIIVACVAVRSRRARMPPPPPPQLQQQQQSVPVARRYRDRRRA